MNKKIPLVGTMILTVIALSISIFFNGCKKDNNCPDGLEGDNCDIPINRKFISEWDVSDNCNGGSNNNHYDLEITAVGSSKTDIMIDGFLDALEVPATVSGNSFTIVAGTYENTDVTGSGTISSDGKTITATYTGKDQFVDASCTGTWTKK